MIPIAYNLQDEQRDLLIIVLKNELQPNAEKGARYTLTTSFQGTILRMKKGMFPSYDSADQKDFMATTQFSPTHARRAFPCFDEPELKATFSITLGRGKEFGTVSNTQVAYEKSRGGDLYWDFFEAKYINDLIYR